MYTYLLRGLTIERPNQVCSADITYIPVQGGFLYLVAIMDWASRRVLAWRLSNTMDTSFCLAALAEALQGYGIPEIFNTDQGSRQPARLTAIGARLGIQGVEAAAAVVEQPVTEGFGGHAGAQRARNGVLALGLGTQLVSNPWRAGGQMDQVGDQAVAEQRHLAAQLLFGVIHGGVCSVCGPCDPVFVASYGAVSGGSGPRLC